jgi:ethanolamine utilization protein EutM
LLIVECGLLKSLNNQQSTFNNHVLKGSSMPSEALGLLECKGLVSLMEGTDAMLKAANVEMMGWDKAGAGLVTAFVKGDVAAVKASVDAGAEAAGRVGTVVAVHVIPRPHDDLGGMMPKKKGAASPAPAAMKK